MSDRDGWMGEVAIPCFTGGSTKTHYGQHVYLPANYGGYDTRNPVEASNILSSTSSDAQPSKRR
jgi:hypothetical protein